MFVCLSVSIVQYGRVYRIAPNFHSLKFHDFLNDENFIHKMHGLCK